MRALLEVHAWMSAADPSFPTICLPCAGAVHEIING